MFDLRTYAENLFSSNNDSSKNVDVKITERNLSNNQDYDEMLSAKYPWKTTEGTTSVKYPADQEANAIVALQPQRIRVFRIEYTEPQYEELAD